MAYAQQIEVFSGNVRYVKDTGENLIQMMDYTPTVVTAVGTVVVIGACPCITNENGPTGNGMEANILGSIRIRGGIYNCTVDGAIPPRTRVYWNATTKKVTMNSAGNTHFGYTCQTASTAANQPIPVEHNPDASPTGTGAPISIVAAGATLTNSTAATVMGSITIPANNLKVGDTVRVRAMVSCPSTNSTDTLTLTALLTPGTSGGAVTIGATAAVDVANNDIGYFDFEFVVRTAGATGTMVGTGVQGLGTPGTVTAKPFAMQSQTIDTTQAQIIQIQGQWSVANAGDQARLDILDVLVTRS